MMAWLLDTNVLSELLRPQPDEGVCRWLNAQDEQQLYVCSVTQAEMLLGVALMPDGRRKTALQTQVEILLNQDFAGRMLAFDSSAAQAYAPLVMARRQMGRPIAQADAQIAAVAAAHGLTVATRNQKDFEGVGVPLLNPWVVSGH